MASSNSDRLPDNQSHIERDFIPPQVMQPSNYDTEEPLKSIIGRGPPASSLRPTVDQNLVYQAGQMSVSSESLKKRRTKSNLELEQENKQKEKEIFHLKSQLETEKLSLYHWQNCANDYSDRLARLSNLQQGKGVGELYMDAGFKRVLNALIAENDSLKGEFSGRDAQSLYIKLNKQNKKIESLKQELAVKFSENQRLRKITEEHDNDKLKEKLVSEQDKITQLRLELASVKQYLLFKTEHHEYLKNLFDKLNDDLIKLFTQHYLKDGDSFIAQLKSLNNDDEIPEFLKQSLSFNQGTQTESLCSNSQESQTDDIDNDYQVDSGFESITSNNQEMIKTLLKETREKEEAHKEKERKQKELVEMKVEEAKLKEQLNDYKQKLLSQKKELDSLEFIIKEVHDDAAHVKQRNEELQADNEALRTSTEYQLVEELRKELKVTEELNKNLQRSIGGKLPGQRTAQIFQKSYSADNKSARDYPTATQTYQEQLQAQRNSEYHQIQARNEALEPWQAPSNQRMNFGFHPTLIAAGGPNLQRDSIPIHGESTKATKPNPVTSTRPNVTSPMGFTSHPETSSSSSRRYSPTLLDDVPMSISSDNQGTFACHGCHQYIKSNQYLEHKRRCEDK